jgi:perosamine synthetase
MKLKKNFYNRLTKLINHINIKNKIKPINLHEPVIDNTDKKSLAQCLNSGFVSTYGNLSNKFCQKIKDITESKYVTPIINGTSSIHLALHSSGVTSNDEVLMPSLNFIASANATLYLGASPHFVEVEMDTLGVDPVKLNKYLREILFKKGNFFYNKKTKKRIKTLIAVHVFGHPCKVDMIKKVCDKYNIDLIEDASECLGSFYKNKHVGNFGKYGILSFNGNKIITSGCGGAILTNNKNLFKRINHISTTSKKNHKWEYDYSELGFNYRLPNLNCALGLSQIKKIQLYLRKKRNLFKLYNNLLKKFDIKEFELIKEPKNCKSNYWLHTIKLKTPSNISKNKILKLFNDRKILIRPLWKLNHKISYLRKYPKMNLKISNLLEKSIINLPSSVNLKL